MHIVPEALIARLVSPQDAFSAMEACFAAMARGEARNFPVVREALGGGRQYGFKSGLDAAGGQLGVKAGGYFPGNAARGITNHQSTVYLFDPETGRPTAMVGGNLLTALRTAAASALSIDRLARRDARVLGILGAGHQAQFQLRAAARVRAFGRVVAWNRTPDKLGRLGAVAAERACRSIQARLPTVEEYEFMAHLGDWSQGVSLQGRVWALSSNLVLAPDLPNPSPIRSPSEVPGMDIHYYCVR
jgi:ornithine cyclodeaminase